MASFRKNSFVVRTSCHHNTCGDAIAKTASFFRNSAHHPDLRDLGFVRHVLRRRAGLRLLLDHTLRGHHQRTDNGRLVTEHWLRSSPPRRPRFSKNQVRIRTNGDRRRRLLGFVRCISRAAQGASLGSSSSALPSFFRIPDLILHSIRDGFVRQVFALRLTSTVMI